jgi:hypothetical protein
MASLPAFDGWADQYFCYDETKDYVLPNNRHATQYCHDHAVGITSENAYNGELLHPTGPWCEACAAVEHSVAVLMPRCS